MISNRTISSRLLWTTVVVAAVASSVLAPLAWAMECYRHWELTLIDRSDGVVTEEDADSASADTLVWRASGPALRSVDDTPFYLLRPFSNSNTWFELELEP